MVTTNDAESQLAYVPPLASCHTARAHTMLSHKILRVNRFQKKLKAKIQHSTATEDKQAPQHIAPSTSPAGWVEIRLKTLGGHAVCALRARVCVERGIENGRAAVRAGDVTHTQWHHPLL
jgi:hypothetical protein